MTNHASTPFPAIGPLRSAEIDSQRAHIRNQITRSTNGAHVVITIGGLAVILTPYLLAPSIFSGLQGGELAIGALPPLLAAFMLLVASCMPGAALMLFSLRFFRQASWWREALHLLEHYDPSDKANASTNRCIHRICIVEPCQAVQEYRARVLMVRPYFTNGDIVYMQHLYERNTRPIAPHDTQKALGIPLNSVDLQFQKCR